MNENLKFHTRVINAKELKTLMVFCRQHNLNVEIYGDTDKVYKQFVYPARITTGEYPFGSNGYEGSFIPLKTLLKTKFCINCGNEIPVDLSKRSDRKYCSKKCRYQANYKNRTKKERI